MYSDYEIMTKQIAAALRRGEYDYAQVLLKSRAFPVRRIIKKRALNS